MTSAQGYANRLSNYDRKGALNLQEAPDPPLILLRKARLLAHRLRDAKHVVVHTGAGISTAAGIRDFRGPTGVWTEEQQSSEGSPTAKRRRRSNAAVATVSFEDAVPTFTHAAITALHNAGYIKHVVSQNVDGLHTRSGLTRSALSELHGNLFVDWCADCKHEVVRETEVSSVGFSETGTICPLCGNVMTDKALDWEDELPEPDFSNAQTQCAAADFHLVVGTSCQMEPARGLPFRGRSGKRDRVIVNLSCTGFDSRFGMRVRGACDDVFAVIVQILNVRVVEFQRVVRMAFQAVRLLKGGVKCSGRMLRDGEWCNRTVAGVTCVCYRCVRDGDTDAKGVCTTAANTAGYRAVGLPDCEFIDAEVHIDGGAHMTCTVPVNSVDEHTIQFTSTPTTYCETGKKLVDGLESQVEADLEAGMQWQSDFSPDDAYGTGKRRGYVICVICKREVWSGQGKREAHLGVCLQNVDR